jgi:hyperosmotically inducible periplasmic protein
MVIFRNKFRSTLSAVLLALTSACTLAVPAPAQDQSAPPPKTEPDNSGNNKQHALTADQQTNNEGDRAIARKIRQSVMGDKSLSTYAHNVKIIVVNGAVTLKGPVDSMDEKKRVGDIASQVAGSPDTVVNDLSVRSKTN